MSRYDLDDNLESRKEYILSYYQITNPAINTRTYKTEYYVADECREMAREVKRKIPGTILSANGWDLQGKLREIQENLEEVLELSTEAIVILGEPFAYNSIQRTIDGLNDTYGLIQDAFIEQALIPAVNYCNEQQIAANDAAYTNATNARSRLGSNTSNAQISEVVLD